MPAPAHPRSPRKDAVANRARILDAAAEVFRRDGFGASVEKIAREAGINVATLYRNFPSKTALIVAIGESLMAPLAASREAALATARPGAIGRFLTGQIAVYHDHRGVVDALGMPNLAPEARERLLELAAEVLGPVVDRGHQDGSLARRFDARDLLTATRMANGAIASATNSGRDPERYLAVLARGLAT